MEKKKDQLASFRVFPISVYLLLILDRILPVASQKSRDNYPDCHAGRRKVIDRSVVSAGYDPGTESHEAYCKMHAAAHVEAEFYGDDDSCVLDVLGYNFSGKACRGDIRRFDSGEIGYGPRIMDTLARVPR